ncbi:MAG: hypothetical protein HYR88_02945, partial [Verrucomicrobia bacterium]|nr:hypothetical protein [Verrucomicrobiota bacterium]
RPESEFPSYVFIEPRYYWAPSPDNWDPGPGDFLPPNSDHVPGDILNGERLIATIYNALRSNADLWNSTLFVIVFDEHGGFYDHEGTPSAVPPEGRSQKPGAFAFQLDRLGVRVPALLISPWIDKGVVHTQFDHTSILRYLTDKWGSARSAHASPPRTASTR